MIKCGIYIIKNITNNKFYIGSSKEIQKRWKRHKYELNNNKHHNTHLQNAWNKYGECNFVFDVIRRCADKNLMLYEQELLDAYASSKLTYNMSSSASGGDILSTHPNRENIIERIKATSRAAISHLTPEERKQKWGRFGADNPNYGNCWSKEMRDAASDATKNRFKSQDERDKISKARKAYFENNPEARKIMSEFAKSRVGNKNPFYGKKHSAASKKKIRNALKGKYSGHHERAVMINGIRYKSLTDAAKNLSVVPATIIHRIKSKNPKFSSYMYCQ